MKRLLKKSAVPTTFDVEIGDQVELGEDEKYKGKTMNDLSRPSEKDGSILVDTKEGVCRWGLNGETHSDLMGKYYNISQDNDNTYLETDSYVVPGVYLKDFLGYETIILYDDGVAGVEDVILNDKPGARVYVDDWDTGSSIQRIASRFKFKGKNMIRIK